MTSPTGQTPEQNPPRRESHDSPDWIDRAAADIRDLNPDYHDFEVEVARIIRAAQPTGQTPGRGTPLRELVEKWRRYAAPSNSALDAYSNGCVTAFGECADELAAALDAHGPETHPYEDLVVEMREAAETAGWNGETDLRLFIQQRLREKPAPAPTTRCPSCGGPRGLSSPYCTPCYASWKQPGPAPTPDAQRTKI